MKQLFIAVAMLAIAAAPADAQAFLNKMKEKAAGAVGNAIGGNIKNVLGEKAKDYMPEEVKNMAEMSETMSNAPQGVTGEQALPPRRASSFGWDGPVTPSAAKFPIPLMNEFPAVPSPAELAHPTEENQIAYYKAIKAVTLRAEELNESTTCEDQETLMWRKKSDKMLSDLFGLTPAEIKMLEDENLPQAEKDRLTEKMQKALLGDIDVNALEKEASKYENMSEAEITEMMGNKTLSALDPVYDRNAADIQKYMGVTAAELKAASRAQMRNANPGKECPEMQALNNKSKAYQKAQAAKDPTFQAKANAFEKRMQAETREATMKASSLSSMGGGIGSMMNAMEKAKPIMELEQKMSNYFMKTQKLLEVPDNAVDAKFSAADRKKLLDLKEKIYATDNPSVYNPLFQQAYEIIKTYRDRAAQVWAADVQKRFDQMKANMSELIKLNRQAVADEIIPECALWRMPLNAVISAGDILAEAYSECPAEYPPMYNQEVIREVPVSKVPGTYAAGWFPEFSVFGASHFDDIVAGKYFFASNAEGEVYQFNAGNWTKLTNEKVKELSKMKYDYEIGDKSWTSQDGKRIVKFNAAGGYIMLPEGDEIFQPHAWKAYSNRIQWVYMNTTEDGKIQLILCTYKL
ncbi:MAG: hypothetical protein IKZ60_06305 [Bacteroidales bacterium]|nr:hypothetical protein [Bacteroidales bacterium]